MNKISTVLGHYGKDVFSSFRKNLVRLIFQAFCKVQNSGPVLIEQISSSRQKESSRIDYERKTVAVK